MNSLRTFKMREMLKRKNLFLHLWISAFTSHCGQKEAETTDMKIISDGEKESKTTNMKISDDGEKDGIEDAMNEKKGKKKRVKSSNEDPKFKTNKRKEEKERRDHLEQLHAESQRLLRETRGASFKPVPLVQKPISSILEKIRQRKLQSRHSQSCSFYPLIIFHSC